MLSWCLQQRSVWPDATSAAGAVVTFMGLFRRMGWDRDRNLLGPAFNKQSTEIRCGGAHLPEALPRWDLIWVVVLVQWAWRVGWGGWGRVTAQVHHSSICRSHHYIQTGSDWRRCGGLRAEPSGWRCLLWASWQQGQCCCYSLLRATARQAGADPEDEDPPLLGALLSSPNTTLHSAVIKPVQSTAKTSDKSNQVDTQTTCQPAVSAHNWWSQIFPINHCFPPSNVGKYLFQYSH